MLLKRLEVRKSVVIKSCTEANFFSRAQGGHCERAGTAHHHQGGQHRARRQGGGASEAGQTRQGPSDPTGE